MADVTCTCCGRTAPGLDRAPFRDETGAEVLANTCRSCWQDWLAMQVKLINEYQLLPVNPEHGEILERNLKIFLKLPSAPAAEADETGDPDRA